MTIDPLRDADGSRMEETESSSSPNAPSAVHALSAEKPNIVVSAVPWESDSIPSGNQLTMFMYMAAIWCVGVALFLSGKIFPAIQQVANGLIGAGFFAILAFVVFRIVQSVRRTRRRKTTAALQDSPRLRIVGTEKDAAAVLAEVESQSSEPLVLRSVWGVQIVKQAVPGLPPVVKIGKKTKKLNTIQPRAPWSRLAIAASIFVGLCLVVGLRWSLFRTWRGFNMFDGWSAFAFGALLSAFITPVYVRIAPGVVDLFKYRPFGFGRPEMDRYDLRTATIALDLDYGWIRIEDASRRERPVLFLKPALLLGEKHIARAVFAAALTTVATPPMPEDRLSE